MGIEEYRKKRNTKKSGEPKGEKMHEYSNEFVIQKHDASNLHYDFRLQYDGVLKSWAVPKGPSTDTKDKRLAIEVEDHPVDYKKFEGVIPEDEYGGGTVIVWDKGKYHNLRKTDLKESLKQGTLEVYLDGEKLQGGYALTRINDDEKQWLLIKMDDEEADARRNPTKTEPKSVISGKTLKKVKDEDE